MHAHLGAVSGVPLHLVFSVTVVGALVVQLSLIHIFPGPEGKEPVRLEQAIDATRAAKDARALKEAAACLLYTSRCV